MAPASLLAALLLAVASVEARPDRKLLISNGWDATETQRRYDWTVRIGRTELRDHGVWTLESYCSGVLIRPDVVLTAAHCFTISDGTPIAERLANQAAVVGIRDLAESHDTWEELPIIQTLLHPAFRPASQAGGPFVPPTNDIALLLLAGNSTHAPPALAEFYAGEYEPVEVELGDTLAMVGWGVMEELKNGEPAAPQVLQYSGMELTAPPDCAAAWPGVDTTTGICAESATVQVNDTSAASICMADGGSPPFLPSPAGAAGAADVVVGVASFGRNCAAVANGTATPAPSVFTSVAQLRCWIESNADCLQSGGACPVALTEDECSELYA